LENEDFGGKVGNKGAFLRTDSHKLRTINILRKYCVIYAICKLFILQSLLYTEEVLEIV